MALHELYEVRRNAERKIVIFHERRTAWLRGKQGSVYFGDMEKVNVTTVYMVVSELAETYDWFADCVNDIKMLRIEEQSDLKPFIEHQHKLSHPTKTRSSQSQSSES